MKSSHLNLIKHCAIKMYGRAEVYLNIAEAVGHWLLNAEGQVQSQGSPRGSYSSQYSSEAVFL